MMNNLIKHITRAGVLVMFMLIAASGVKAQTSADAQKFKNSTPEQRAAMQDKLMKQELNLSDVQYTQVSALNLEYARKMQPIINSDESRFSKGRKARALLKEKDEKLKKILTQQQYDLYQQKVQEMTSKLKEAYSKQ